MGTRMFSFILRFVFSDKSLFFSSFSFSAFRIFTVVFVVVFLCFRVFIFQRYKNGVRAESMAQIDGKKTWRRARVNLNK